MVLGAEAPPFLLSDTLIHPFSKGKKKILSAASYFPKEASVYLASQNPFSVSPVPNLQVTSTRLPGETWFSVT